MPNWEKFYNNEKHKYDYKKHKYKIFEGLDCSGYVGWAVNNLFCEKINNPKGWVFNSNVISKKYAEMGLGTFTKRECITNYRPGDIMSGYDHVFIVIGQCSDQSLVIIHSSPNGGVKINGTVDIENSSESEAIKLATYYMKTRYPEWSTEFGEFSKGIEYLKEFDQFRWDDNILKDPDELYTKTPEEILLEIFK